MKTPLLAAVLALATLAAQADVLDFGSGPAVPSICTVNGDGIGPLTACTDYAKLSQSYGDIPGVLDVQYSQPLATTASTLNWWSTSYNTLYGVLWADGGDGPSSYGRIDLVPLAGASGITLTSLDLGAYPSTTRNTELTIFDLGNNQVLYSYTGSVGTAGGNATTFSLGVSSAAGLRIEWRNTAYNVGIDNIVFQTTAVPEPASGSMALAGLAVLGAAFLRRRQPR
ncbi:MAG: PEP-CTERM sorting domain-containing protein [Burkholderiales bacterium]|nr:MAG: PEP-CTERM sorting domain-containing protein [Burkholderiales bacterium]